MQPRMYYDDAAWEKSEEIADSWVRQFLDPDILRPVGGFLVRHHDPDNPDKFTILEKRAFNISADGVRKRQFRRDSISPTRDCHARTSIRVPFVLHWGTKMGSPMTLSPFVTMKYIDHHTNMYDALNTPDCPAADRGVLDPNISEMKLHALYGELGGILLELAALSMSRIGCLDQKDDFTWETTLRPLSMPMIEPIRLGSLPRSKLPCTTFDSASSYFEALSQLHVSHLVNQRNDAVASADDCRRKFVAGSLFLKLARSHRLTSKWSSFETVHSRRGPEYWPKGLGDWCTEYERRLQSFPGALVRREDDAIKQGRMKRYQRLSGPMRHSWESGDLWVAYAARNNFTFDAIYWEKIDQRFFESNDCNIDEVWRQRLELLSDSEKGEMEDLVNQKTREIETRALEWDPDEYTLGRINVVEAAWCLGA
ncbi:uncharacterized protein KD926_003233 [Aspergillus affinis]|uniref:uncharacterized protein n=1 Tax=Aspergillus affinis TaxID=1070780 RepID=UPI0022FE2566|nr:uncharacterized protein KD926_003233 [Aspergillus affinis]KAI9035573.1 hypothetical protein KD926_003233 [Aspergillus affinis]